MGITRITPTTRQRSAVSKVFALLAEGAPSVLVVAPTGAGKTVTMADVAQQATMRGERVLAVVNLQVLLGQTVDTFENGFGLPCSALHDKITHYRRGDQIMPLTLDYSRRVLVTMPMTLNNTVNGDNNLYFDPSFEPSMILLDEAHKATAAEFQAIRNRWPHAKVVGFTATPHREKNDSGESLEEWYGDRMIFMATMSELIEEKLLAQPRYVEVGEMDMTMAEHWLLVTMGETNKRTIIFTDDTNHSKALEAQFRNQNIRVEVVTSGRGVVGDDDYVATQLQSERDEIFARFHGGETDVLISVNALCEGFDEKLARYCFLTRRVANIALYQQMCGRVLRWHDDKPEGYIYDFEGNLKEHGPVEAIEWPRASKGKMVREGESMSRASYDRATNVWTTCSHCDHVYNIKKTSNCRVCGSAHDIKVTNTVADMITALGATRQQFEGFANIFVTAMGGDATFQRIANNKLNMEVFVNGELVGHMGYMPSVVEAYLKNAKRKGNALVGDWSATVALAA